MKQYNNCKHHLHGHGDVRGARPNKATEFAPHVNLQSLSALISDQFLPVDRDYQNLQIQLTSNQARQRPARSPGSVVSARQWPLAQWRCLQRWPRQSSGHRPQRSLPVLPSRPSPPWWRQAWHAALCQPLHPAPAPGQIRTHQISPRNRQRLYRPQINILDAKRVVIMRVVRVVGKAIMLFFRIMQQQTKLHPLTSQLTIGKRPKPGKDRRQRFAITGFQQAGPCGTVCCPLSGHPVRSSISNSTAASR